MINAIRNFFSVSPAPERYVAIDVETTGLSPKVGDRVVQLALADISETVRLARCGQTDWRVSATTRLFDPQREIPPAASRVHGIYDQDVADAGLFCDAIDEIREFIGDAVLVAHNADFDRGFIDSEFRKAGVGPLTNRWVCTLQMARERWDLRSYKLGAILRQLSMPMDQEHDAAHDAIGAGMVYAALQFPVR